MKLFSQSIIAIIAIIVRTSSNLVLGILLARELAPEQFGVFSIGASILAIVMPLVALGLENIMLITFSRYEKVNSELLNKKIYNAFLITVLTSLIVFVVLSILVGYLYQENLTYTIILISMFFTIIIFGPIEILTFAVQGLGNVRPKMISLHIILPLSRLVFIFLSLIFGLELLSLSIGYIISSLILLFVGLYYYLQQSELNFLRGYKFDIAISKNLLKVSLPLLAVGGITYTIQNIDNILVGMIANEKEAGIFGTALKISMIISISSLAISNIVNPLISKFIENRQKLIDTIYNSTYMYTLVTVPIWIFIYLYANLIIDILVGPDYLNAVVPLKIMATSQLLFSLITSFSWFILSTKYRIIDISLIIICLLLSLLLNILLDRQFGSTGAALSNILSFSLLIVLRLFLVFKKLALDFKVFSKLLITVLLIIPSIIITDLVNKLNVSVSEFFMAEFIAILIIVIINLNGTIWLIRSIKSIRKV